MERIKGGNPFLERQKAAPKNNHGKRSEVHLAKSLNARLTLASGAVAGSKGDLKHNPDGFKILMEAKSTTTATLAVQHEWLAKIENEALAKSSIPALAISFVNPEGRAKPMGEWVALPKWAYLELLEKANGSKLAE